MKKRIISVALVLAMMLSMTAVVSAAENDWESEIDTLGAAVVDGVHYHDMQEAADAAAENGGVLKLLEEPAETIAVNGDLNLDLNGFTVSVDAGNVTVVDSSTNNGTEGGKLYGDYTVNNRVTVKNGISYVVLNGSDGNGDYITSNAVRVKVKKVNIRPSEAGLYYVTDVMFNKNIADVGATYGVALSLADKPGNDFLTDEDTLWTSFTAPKGSNFSEYGTSCLVNDILDSTAYTDDENAERGGMDVYANAYVKMTVDGEDIVVMMENVSDVTYSLKKVMQILDGQLETELLNYAAGTGSLSETGTKALDFFETWNGAMTKTGWDLVNLAEALLKKNAA